MEDNPAGSAMSPRQTRALKTAIAVMSALIVVGLLALVYGLYSRTAGTTPQVSVPRAAVPLRAVEALPFALPPDAEIAHIAADGSRIVLHLRGGGADALITLNGETGAVLGRVPLTR